MCGKPGITARIGTFFCNFLQLFFFWAGGLFDPPAFEESNKKIKMFAERLKYCFGFHMPDFIQPAPWLALPFVGLLAMIALAPLFFADWWGRHFIKISIGLGAVVVFTYMSFLHGGERVGHTAMDYFSFITLIGGLFIVSGGIHIGVKGESTPLENVRFLFLGAVIANLLGTTGASMLLIRPWIRMNKYRVTAHHIVFFIFIVSNVGGCLTPIGDPPLFLGYLLGVPFFATMKNLWPMWCVGVGMLLVMFYCVDRKNYMKAPKAVRDELAEPADKFSVKGLMNLVFLGMILGAVFIKKPMFVRELLMIVASIGSYYLTNKQIHEANHFNFHPLKEVAVLFAGIFATMMPALDWLAANAARFGKPGAASYYFASGTLSSVLDNAPTYLSFLNALFGETGSRDISLILSSHPQIVWAISIGSVFFGANTYIGNGPNFMVKAIADHQRVHTPNFIAYIWRYSLPIMGPMLLVIWLLFFR
jgi:Na+/H+ antiporter NhaD/arsenite permease-like protein